LKKQKIGDICRIDDQDRAAADPLTLNFLESQASLGDSRLQLVISVRESGAAR